MNEVERIFFHMVCAECLLNGKITDEWVQKMSNGGDWSYNNLLEILCKWSLEGVYTYTRKVADGRLEFGKLYGVYRKEEEIVRKWS